MSPLPEEVDDQLDPPDGEGVAAPVAHRYVRSVDHDGPQTALGRRAAYCEKRKWPYYEHFSFFY